MAYVNDCKWSCSGCGKTFTAYGSEADTLAAIKAVQGRHAKAHADAMRVVARLGLTEDHPADSRRKSA
jgi:hypothetical protein